MELTSEVIGSKRTYSLSSHERATDTLDVKTLVVDVTRKTSDASNESSTSKARCRNFNMDS